ncbi:MAG: DUF1565 domain-containing protein, partial [Fibrobacteraceae bacterium]|nr:DUF1565 domain-containing protein [Fibrobacteraceae bacterium]
MKSISAFLLTLVTSVTVFAAGKTTFYVSPAGSDANDGSKDKPFKTLTQAQKAVRAVNKDMTGDVIVYLREGTYQLTSTFKLTNADGGF